MTQPDPASFSKESIARPETTPGELAQAATVRPDLWDDILAHPNCPESTSEWIRQNRPAKARQTDPALGQITAGARQMATGARDYFGRRVGTVSEGGGSSAPGATAGIRANSPLADGRALRWALFLLIASAFLVFISIFMPIVGVSAFGYSQDIGFFSSEVDLNGPILIVGTVLTMLAAGAALFLKPLWAGITAAVLGVITGIIAATNGFGASADVTQAAASAGAFVSVQPKFGMVLICIASILLMIAALAVATLQILRRRAAVTA